jgi:hypothetical protein
MLIFHDENVYCHGCPTPGNHHHNNVDDEKSCHACAFKAANEDVLRRHYKECKKSEAIRRRAKVDWAKQKMKTMDVKLEKTNIKDFEIPFIKNLIKPDDDVICYPNFCNIISQKYKMTTRSVTVAVDKARDKILKLLSIINRHTKDQKNKEYSDSVQYDAKFARYCSSQFKEAIDGGHSIDNRSGGANIRTNKVYQTEKLNRTLLRYFLDFWKFQLKFGYTVKIVDGQIMEADIPKEYREKKSTGCFNLDFNGDRREISAGGYRLFDCTRKGDNKLEEKSYAFVYPNFGLPDELTKYKVNRSYPQLCEILKPFAIELDVLAPLAGFEVDQEKAYEDHNFFCGQKASEINLKGFFKAPELKEQNKVNFCFYK